MHGRSEHNEGIRILEELVCQAIPDPSATTEQELAVVGANPDSLSATLLSADGRLRERIEIGNGVALSPLFGTLGRAGAANGNDFLTFVLRVPTGLATNVVATALAHWLGKLEARKALTHGIEVPVSGATAEDVVALARALRPQTSAAGPNDP